MSLILDTHAILWNALDDPQMGQVAHAAILNESGTVYISPASYWEIAIKISLGKYKFAMPFENFWHQAIVDADLTILPMEIAHAARILQLPHIHRDPFDRLIIAQALCENLTVVSNDSVFDQYGVRRIW